MLWLLRTWEGEELFKILLESGHCNHSSLEGFRPAASFLSPLLPPVKANY